MQQLVQLILAGQSASIEFLDMELPAAINFGGEQMVSVHQYIGGRRILDAMGASDAPINWSGTFITSAAVDRARFCDTLRRTGEECTLTWGPFSYTGIVQAFKADFTRGGLYVPYQITFLVAQDKTAFVTKPPELNLEAQITADMLRADALNKCINDNGLSGFNSAVQSAVSIAIAAIKPIAKGVTSAVNTADGPVSCAVKILNNATSTVLAAISPVAKAQAKAQVLITSSEQAITGVTTGGGLLPGNPVAKMTGKFITQVNAAIKLPPLYEYSALMGRTQRNLTVAANQGPTAKTIQVGGGTLQQVAAQQYGDATLWPLIAQANGMTDPQISGIQTLIIPPKV